MIQSQDIPGHYKGDVVNNTIHSQLVFIQATFRQVVFIQPTCWQFLPSEGSFIHLGLTNRQFQQQRFQVAWFQRCHSLPAAPFPPEIAIQQLPLGNFTGLAHSHVNWKHAMNLSESESSNFSNMIKVWMKQKNEKYRVFANSCALNFDGCPNQKFIQLNLYACVLGTRVQISDSSPLFPLLC